MQTEAFPNYTQIPSFIPQLLWWILRSFTLLLTVFVIFLLFTKPDVGLVLIWKLLIPLLPLSFAVIPGLWRNICPMALLNQLPRQFGFSREYTLSTAWRKVALYLSIASFVLFILLRHPLLNHSGLFLGIILTSALVLALLGGLLFKGRSGWCGTFCPLAPLQKAYGHAPLVLVKNGYCDSCVGCQKNCYDFNPRAAFFSDLDNSEPEWSEQRRFFIALLPGLIIAYYNTSFLPQTELNGYLKDMLLPPLVSIGVFYLVHNLLHINFYRLASVYTMTALGIFYWHGLPVVNAGAESLFQLSMSIKTIGILQYSILGIGVLVVIRSLISERHFHLSKQVTTKASLGKGVEVLRNAMSQTSKMVIVDEISSDQQLMVQSGQTLLDALEENDMPIMSGCRMGMCGSDPVVIVDGHDNLDPPDENELNTLRRLGLEGKARLACCCRPRAKISIDLDADPTQYKTLIDSSCDLSQITESKKPRVIIIGNGIAGISTAENLRKQNCDWDIVIISDENYHFYNRMGLESVLYGRTAMQGLYLLKEDWYQLNCVDTWLNTQVTAIDSKAHEITLGTGETITYDKLVLATGALAFVPPQAEYQLPGVFTLRSAEDALAIRRHTQQTGSKQAIVLGGGVLGVEAAEALLQMGMKVTILHHSKFLMNRQLDTQAAEILKTFFDNKGIKVITGTGIQSIAESGIRKPGSKMVVQLESGRTLTTDILLLCIGVRSNMNLAQTAGLDVNRGIVVDSKMQTSNPDVYCVGDAAELPGALGGLWSIGSEQGKIAANAILGGEDNYQNLALPPVQLKVSGIDLKSFGSLDTENHQSFTDGDSSKHTWRHLRVEDGHLRGGVFVNSPLSAVAAINASKNPDRILSTKEIEEILHKDS